MVQRRSKSAVFPACLVGCACFFVFRRWSPAYTVQANDRHVRALSAPNASDLSPANRGLEFEVGFSPEGQLKKIAMGEDKGLLNLGYAAKFDKDTALNVFVNSEGGWKTDFQGKDKSLHVEGDGANPDFLSWQANQRGHVDHVGDVQVRFNSEREYNLEVVRRKLAELGGIQIDAKVRSSNDGVSGQLGARKNLSGGAEMAYSVQNPVGDYQLGSAAHNARLQLPALGGTAAFQFNGDLNGRTVDGKYTRDVLGGRAKLHAKRLLQYEGSSSMRYNISYERNLGQVPPNTNVQVGMDSDGVYGQLEARYKLGHDLQAEYEASGRMFTNGNQDPVLRHNVALASKLGYARLHHEVGKAPLVRLGYNLNA